MGVPSSSMDLEIFSTTDRFLQKIDNDEALFGSYPVDDECRIHVRTILKVPEMQYLVIW